MSEPLDKLLEQLSKGDMDAAGQVFTAFEPYLRKAVRRQFPASLRSKFDSTDILQSVWADVLRGFRKAGWRFVDADHLRGFLFIATRNRLVDRIRQHKKAADREEAFVEGDRHPLVASTEPRPSEMAQASDMWQRIVMHCPPAHRPVLTLKRQGYSLAEIADRTGLHPDSVRRILRTLARRLAFETRGGSRPDDRFMPESAVAADAPGR
jgi:RNA polymerase sigma-70 factor (ECF subfamily)